MNKFLLCLLGLALFQLVPDTEGRRGRSRGRSRSPQPIVPVVPPTAPAPAPEGLLLSEYILLLDESLNGFTNSIIDAVGMCFGMGCSNGTIAMCATCLADTLVPPMSIPSTTPTAAPVA